MKNQVHKQFYSIIMSSLDKCSTPLTKWRRAIAIDPSFIHKSGKKTPYMGSFWSGCSQSIKRGLEMMGIAAIDIDNRIALHLEVVQTPPTKTLSNRFQSLLDWYCYLIEQRVDKLLQISTVIVADAFFAKRPFVHKV